MATVVQTISNPPQGSPGTLYTATTTPSATLGASPTDQTDFLVAVLNLVTAGTVTAQNGYTIVNDYQGTHSLGDVVIARKKVGASEPAAQSPFVTPSSQGDITIYQVHGLDQTTPLDAVFQNERGSAAATALSATTSSLAAGNKFVCAGVRTGGSDGGSLTWSAPTGMTGYFEGFGGGSGSALLTPASSGVLTCTVNTVSAVFASLAGAVFKDAVTGGQPKVFSGSYTRKPMKLAASTKTVKRYNGSAWVALS